MLLLDSMLSCDLCRRPKQGSQVFDILVYVPSFVFACFEVAVL
jgi:hypothetical protein